MTSVQTQTFDFTPESNQQEFEKWKDAITALPFLKKDYWIDGLALSDEKKAGIALTATYQFLDVDNDTWFWLSVILKKDGTASLDFHCNYSIDDELELLPIVNQLLVNMGFEEADELNTLPGRELKDWQEGYDLLCSIVRKTKITPIVVR